MEKLKRNWALYLGIVWFLLALASENTILELGILIGPLLIVFWGFTKLSSKAKAQRKPALVVETPEKVFPYEHLTFRIAGTTYKNEDGTSRQTLLRKIKFRDPPFDTESVNIALEEESYNGEPSIAVKVKGQLIGYVPKDKVPYIVDNWDRIDKVSGFNIIGGGRSKETEEWLSYGAEVVVRFFKEGADRNIE